MLAEGVGDGRRSVGERGGLLWVEGIEDQALHVLGVVGGDPLQAGKPSVCQRGVLRPTIVGIIGDGDISLLDEQAESVGEPAL